VRYYIDMDILELRKLIYVVNTSLIKINDILLDEYQKQAGYIDAGNGYKIPPLQITDKPIVREDPPCCGG